MSFSVIEVALKTNVAVFRAEMASAAAAVKGFQAEVNTVGSGGGFASAIQGVRGLDTALESLTSRSARGLRLMAQAEAGVGREMVVAGGLITGAFALGLHGAEQFETAMRDVNSVVQGSEKDFKRMSNFAVELSTKVPKSAEDIAKGYYKVASAGFAGAEGEKVLKASTDAAAAGLTTTAEAATTITAVLRAYNLTGEQSGHVSDVLFNIVRTGQVNFQELGTQVGHFIGVASQTGIPLNDIGAAFSTITLATGDSGRAGVQLERVLTSIISPSTALKGVFKDAGFETGQLALQSIGLAKTIELIGKAAGGNQEKLKDYLGDMRAIKGFEALASGGGANYARQQGEFTDVTGRTAAALAEQAKSTSAQVQLMKDEFQKAFIGMGALLLPIFRALIGTLTDVAAAFNSLPEPVKALVGLFGSAAGATLLLVGGLLVMAPKIVQAIQLMQVLGAVRAGATFTEAAQGVGMFAGAVGTAGAAATAGTAQLTLFETAEAGVGAGAVGAASKIGLLTGALKFAGTVGAVVGGMYVISQFLKHLAEEALKTKDAISQIKHADVGDVQGKFQGIADRQTLINTLLKPAGGIKVASEIVTGHDPFFEERKRQFREVADVEESEGRRIIDSVGAQSAEGKVYSRILQELHDKHVGAGQGALEHADALNKLAAQAQVAADAMKVTSGALTGLNVGAARQIQDSLRSQFSEAPVKVASEGLTNFSLGDFNFRAKEREKESAGGAREVARGHKEADQSAKIRRETEEKLADSTQRLADLERNRTRTIEDLAGQQRALAKAQQNMNDLVAFGFDDESQRVLIAAVRSSRDHEAAIRGVADAQEKLNKLNSGGLERQHADLIRAVGAAHRDAQRAVDSLAEAERKRNELLTHGLADEMERLERAATRAVYDHQGAVDSLAEAERKLAELQSHGLADEMATLEERVTRSEIDRSAAIRAVTDAQRTRNDVELVFNETMERQEIAAERAANAQVDAADRQSDAETRLAHLRSGVITSRRDIMTPDERAKEIHRLERELRDARVSSREAVLNETDAERALDRLREDGHERAVAAANDALNSAIMRVNDTTRAGVTAQRELDAARNGGQVRELAAAERAVSDARNRVEDSTLAERDSQRALDAARNGGQAREAAAAENAVADARDRVESSTRAEFDASQALADFEGTGATSATRQRMDAENALADAQTRVLETAVARQQAATALERLDQTQADEEQAAADAIQAANRRIEDSYHSIEAADRDRTRIAREMHDAQTDMANRLAEIVESTAGRLEGSRHQAKRTFDQWVGDERQSLADLVKFNDDIQNLILRGHGALAGQLLVLQKTSTEEATRFAAEARQKTDAELTGLDQLFGTKAEETVRAFAQPFLASQNEIPAITKLIGQQAMTELADGLARGKPGFQEKFDALLKVVRSFGDDTKEIFRILGNDLAKAVGIFGDRLKDTIQGIQHDMGNLLAGVNTAGKPPPTSGPQTEIPRTGDTPAGSRGINERNATPSGSRGLNERAVTEGYAEGGWEDHAPGMYAGGDVRYFAEPETQGESYIPHANDHRRPKAVDITERTANKFGYRLVPMADGGMFPARPYDWDGRAARYGYPRSRLGYERRPEWAGSERGGVEMRALMNAFAELSKRLVAMRAGGNEYHVHAGERASAQEIIAEAWWAEKVHGG